MDVVAEFLDWLLGSLAQLWAAMSSDWGIVGLCFICVPLVRKVFNLFVFYIRGGY